MYVDLVAIRFFSDENACRSLLDSSNHTCVGTLTGRRPESGRCHYTLIDPTNALILTYTGKSLHVKNCVICVKSAGHHNYGRYLRTPAGRHTMPYVSAYVIIITSICDHARKIICWKSSGAILKFAGVAVESCIKVILYRNVCFYL